MQLHKFGTKLIGLAAALLIVAACETAPTVSATAGGTGSTAGSTGAPGTTSGGAGATAVAPGSRDVRPGSQEDLVVNVGDRVFFDFDKFDLKPPARATLDKQAAWLKRFPQVRLSIEGHCDERGTREYNLALGERRANAVKNYLVNQGIPASRLATISYGKERPQVAGANESAWSQNRRGVSIVQ
jgi:peptidoglycan-associated lipoprotein